MIAALWHNLDYAASVILFCIGLYAVITKENLIKKFMGLNLMETAVFAFIVAIGVVEGGEAPIMGPGVEPRAGPTSDAEAERDELAHLIADLDDAYAEGLVNEQAYEQLRARMKKRLLNIWSE